MRHACWRRHRLDAGDENASRPTGKGGWSDLAPRLGEQRRRRLERGGDHTRDLERCQAQRELSLGDACHVEKVIHQPDHVAERLAHGLADPRRAVEQVLVRLVHEIEDVLRALEHADEAGRLLVHPPLPQQRRHFAAIDEDPVGGLDAGAEEAAHVAAGAAYRRVREREVRLFQPAVAVEFQAEVVHVDRLAREDALEERCQHLARLAPDFAQRGAPQRLRVLAPRIGTNASL